MGLELSLSLYGFSYRDHNIYTHINNLF